jgi:hypothetical protein
MRFDSEHDHRQCMSDLHINFIGLIEMRIISDSSVAVLMNFADHKNDK